MDKNVKIRKMDGTPFVNSNSYTVDAIKTTHLATSQPVYAFSVGGQEYTLECPECEEVEG